MAVLFALLLASLYLMSNATQNSEQFGRIYILLFVVNVIELLILAGLIGVNLGTLIRQRRNRATGSRLTTRLVVMFVVLAVAPASVLYYFSFDFIRRGIDSWFDVRVQEAMDDAMELSRTALDWRILDAQRQTKQIAEDISDTTSSLMQLTLDELRYRSGAAQIVVLNDEGTAIGGSPAGRHSAPGPVLDRVVMAQLQQALTYVGIEPGPEAGESHYARVVVNLPEPSVTGGVMLQAMYSLPERLDVLAERVQSAYAQYERLEFLRGPLKFSFILTLSLVLLLSCFTAVWLAFYSARRLVAPIRILAIGTRAVAAGDYHRHLPEDSLAHDELGFLVKSFNAMTHRIATAQDQAHLSQQAAENQKTYLETVLGHLSSGVLTYTKSAMLRTVNPAAEKILGVALDVRQGVCLDDLAAAHRHLRKFVDVLKAKFSDDGASWQAQVVLFGQEGRQVLMCRGACLPAPRPEDAGYVVVFDDITALIQAQRDAAWGEVARRLAHEIKNPLTPIQLSAERLRHRYLATMAPEERSLMDRCTHTIVQQVEAMKKMVEAFSDYARPPKLEIAQVSFNDVVMEVVELYRYERSSLVVDTRLDSRIKRVDADSGRLRQLLHNLIKNAVESMADGDQPKVEVTTRLCVSDDLQALELSVRDHGPGIPEDMLGRLFEPYVSAKPKGSGLGLAIVKKIVEEHNGMIWAENVTGGGAMFVLRLPLRVNSRGGGAQSWKNRPGRERMLR